VQEIPFNISAVTGDEMERQGLVDFADLAKTIPGIFLVNQGARATSLVVVRGLNTNSIGSSEGLGNGNGGVVATYVGDIPLYLDLKLFDMDRAEVLLGPQGTLYGAGTLGGALRYIPNRPDPERQTAELDVSAYGRSHSNGLGNITTAVFNQPLIEGSLAMRAGVGYFYDPGFIDNTHLVRDMGVSDPEPVFSNPADVRANLRQQDDVDTEETKAAKLAFAWRSGSAFGADLSYYMQEQDVGARTVNHAAAMGTGLYESAARVLEPNRRENHLTTLELNGDLSFARLTSATGYSHYDEIGQRDQTDLLLSFQYGYENFPGFVSFTRETAREDTLNQEIRLVSNDKGPFNWIGGVFWNRYDADATSEEFVPGYPADQGIPSSNDLEYLQVTYQTFTESAVFGEVGYEFTPQWQVTVGARYFEFDDEQKVGFALPLVGVPLSFSENAVGDDDVIFKLNTSYQFAKDLLGYLTISEGYRPGGVNAVPPCQVPLPPGQNVCALPNEVLVKPDKTLNHEIGVRSSWLGGRLVLNGALYYIDWTDVQVAGATVNGSVPITVNGAEARSQGVELTARARILDRFRVSGNYSYNDARLSQNAPGIVGGADAFDGDRLPGSPKHQGNVTFGYNDLLPNGWNFTADYSIFAISNVYTRVGLRNNGEILGGFGVHKMAVGVGSGPWLAQLYANNLLDKYAATAVRSHRGNIRAIPTDDPAPDDSFRLRSYYKDPLEPLTVGLTVRYDFQL
jgi:iron complex outermembrane recepter protein